MIGHSFNFDKFVINKAQFDQSINEHLWATGLRYSVTIHIDSVLIRLNSLGQTLSVTKEREFYNAKCRSGLTRTSRFLSWSKMPEKSIEGSTKTGKNSPTIGPGLATTFWKKEKSGLFWWVVAGNPHWMEKLSTVDLPVQIRYFLCWKYYLPL